MAHSYEEGRLNLPFVGIATFGKNPYVSNWSNINADAAIIGAPFDSGAQYRSGARFPSYYERRHSSPESACSTSERNPQSSS